MTLTSTLLTAILLAPLASLSGAGMEVYVSPSGKDDAAGGKSAPFLSIEGALRFVRQQREAGAEDSPIVWLEDGIYPVTSTVALGGADAQITIGAVHEGKAVLDAGVAVPGTALVISEDPRLDAAARGSVVQLDLAPLKLKHIKAFPDRFNDGGGILQLFADDAWQPLSRWPNEHNTVMPKVLDRGDDPGAPGKRPGTFTFAEDRPARWKAAAESGQLWVAGFWRVAWDWQSVRVQTLDPEKKTITLAAPIGGGIGSKYAGPAGAGTEPWRAINLVEEIDTPGEWAVDFAKQTLYWWPPRPPATSRITLADLDSPVFRLKDAKHVTLQGLVIQGALGNGIEITGGEGCAVVGCTIRCLGKNGVVIKGGKAHRVQSCDLHTLGHGGILLGGGDRAQLTPAGHVADNNHLHHYALARKIWTPGIGVGANDAGYACGCTVTHNLIHDAPHAAVLYGGNDNVFEWNEVHDFLIESDDLGGFYSNNDWTSRGNIVRHNFVHHTSHALGVYLDDADSGDTVEGNVFYRMGTGAAIGGGHDNIFRNNLAIECQRGFAIDARGVSRHYEKDPAKLRDLASVQTDSPPWSDRFPTLVNLLAHHPELPTGCIVERNVSVACEKPLDLRARPDELRFSTLRDNAALTSEDLRFADAARMDFRTSPDAPVFEKLPGFAAIPFEKIGLYLDEHRRQLPPHPSGQSTSEWHRPR